ncbi:hypothetical protein [Escherichia coli]|uniref:hypothetical protein n=1 Tax=Escherichia coli TaxID=562 RepID=UPI003013F1A0
MKERGMIFNAEMVRAILDDRKTQTRRIVQPQPELTKGSGFSWKGAVFGSGSDDRETNRNFAHVKCPFGAVGDRIWVRETWWQAGQSCARYPDDDEYGWYGSRRVLYAADGNPPNEPNDHYPKGLGGGKFSAAKPNHLWRKRPSIHMPRWASRFLLEITDVRVERLNDISECDAKAEGVSPAAYAITPPEAAYRVGFGDIWRGIYGEESWAANPWVWVVEFKRIEGGAA